MTHVPESVRSLHARSADAGHDAAPAQALAGDGAGKRTRACRVCGVAVVTPSMLGGLIQRCPAHESRETAWAREHMRRVRAKLPGPVRPRVTACAACGAPVLSPCRTGRPLKWCKQHEPRDYAGERARAMARWNDTDAWRGRLSREIAAYLQHLDELLEGKG